MQSDKTVTDRRLDCNPCLFQWQRDRRHRRIPTPRSAPLKRGNAESPVGAVSVVRAVVRARDLVAGMLCLAPPLFLSNRLPTLHTVTDSKWLVVVFLSAVEIALIAAAAALQEKRERRARPTLIRALLPAAVALAVAHVLSALLCREPGFSFRAAIPSLSLIALFAAMVWRPASPDAIRKLAALMIATGAAVGAVAILQHLGFDPLARLVRYREAERYRTGVFVTLANPEYLGGYLAPLAVAAAGVAMAVAGRRAKVAALIAAAVMGVPAILSGSRGAFLGMIVGAVVLVGGGLTAIPRISRRARIGGVVAAGVTLVILVAVFAEGPRTGPMGLLRARLADVANPHSESLRVRIVFNLVGLEMVASRPVLGVGPGMFGVEFYPSFLRLEQRNPGAAMDVVARDLNGAVAEHAHNDWLEIWAETGTLGFAAWLVVVVTWISLVIRSLAHRTPETANSLFALALASAVAALLVNAFFNFPLHEPVRTTVFWLALAWSAILSSHSRSESLIGA